jgi:hypothetical protein
MFGAGDTPDLPRVSPFLTDMGHEYDEEAIYD